MTAMEFKGDRSFIYVSECEDSGKPLRRNCILEGSLVDRDARTMRNENWTMGTGLDMDGIMVWWEGYRRLPTSTEIHPRVRAVSLGWASPVQYSRRGTPT